MLFALIFAFVGEKLALVMRALLFICCLLLLVVGLALLYYLWATVMISGTCGFIREILRDNRAVLDEVDASVNFRNIMDECFFIDDQRVFSLAED